MGRNMAIYLPGSGHGKQMYVHSKTPTYLCFQHQYIIGGFCRMSGSPSVGGYVIPTFLRES